jgi:predicted aspartyl protease
VFDSLTKATQAHLPIARLAILPAIWLLLPLSFASSAEDSPALSVSAPGAYLYDSQEESSAIITNLEPQETLIPLANIAGRAQSWYLVKTQKGVSGWVKSSDVQWTNEMQKAFEGSIPATAGLSFPEMEKPLPSPSLENAVTVPIEIIGSMVIVPVLLNRSLKTFMLIDTGAGYTTVTPAVAKRLGLRSVSRISDTTDSSTLTIPLTRLGSLKVGDTEVNGLMVKVQTLSHDPRIEGLLGLNFLTRFHTSIDSRHQLLSFAPR